MFLKVAQQPAQFSPLIGRKILHKRTGENTFQSGFQSRRLLTIKQQFVKTVEGFSLVRILNHINATEYIVEDLGRRQLVDQDLLT